MYAGERAHVSAREAVYVVKGEKEAIKISLN